MTIQRNNLLLFIAITLCGFAPVSAGFPDVLVNLNYPEYKSLLYDNGYKQIDDVGINGIIVYRQDATTFAAFERTCSYRGKSECATVRVDASGLYMIDPCCGSTFTFDGGYPTGGPASRPLFQYRTYYADSVIRITDEIIN
jgi:hypothetical protein